MDIVEEVRNSCHELNTEFLTTSNIIDFLNRGQRRLQSILMKKYPEMFQVSHTLTTVPNTREYQLPPDLVEYRIRKVYIYSTSGDPLTIVQKSFRDIGDWDLTSSTDYPDFYVITGRTLTLYPMPSASHTVAIWYIKEFSKLAEPFMTLSSIEYYPSTFELYLHAESLSVDSNGDLLCHKYDLINVTDPYTGILKNTFIIKEVDEINNKITILLTYGNNTVTSIDQTNKFFGFTSFATLPYVRKSDTLTLTGAGSNTGTYTINFIDVTNLKIYVDEDIPSAIVTGTASIVPTSYHGLSVDFSINNIGKDDIVTKAPALGNSEYLSNSLYTDYITQYAIVQSRKKSNEPIEEEYATLKEIESEISANWTQQLPIDEVVTYVEYED
jgi:hypothetical protein